MDMNAKRNFTKEQTKQESEYAFPYHYIPRRDHGNFSQTVNLRWGYEYLSYVSFVLERLSGVQFGSLLDVGCGDGRFLFEVRKQFPACALKGIDISDRAIQLAKIFNPTVHYMAGDITENPLADTFDVITAIEVLEHIPPEQLEEFVRALHLHLKDNGVLIVTVPSTNVRVRSKHYQHFSIGLLREVFHNYFQVDTCYFLNKTGFRRNIIHTLLSNSVFILNAKNILNSFYRYYVRKLLIAGEKDAQRICVICKKHHYERG